MSMASDRQTWTDKDFETMSWHDNHVHGLGFRSGEYAMGVLTLDLDYILEWLCPVAGGTVQFRIAPATLTFHAVTGLQVNIDYASATAATGPFSMSGIRREPRPELQICHWIIDVNWPAGSISFDATGFTQTLWGRSVVHPEQVLAPGQRVAAGA
jgi:hypothetical protein